MRIGLGFLWLAATLAACSDSARSLPGAAGDAGAGGDAAASFSSGIELRIVVPEAGRVFVKLAAPAVVVVGDPKASLDWDLAFEGLDVFTNSGVSGQGQAAAFGPLEAIDYIFEEAPPVPFLMQDKTGGAFLDWYAYEGASSHALWSRYHVFGVKDGARLWKVQVLTYYGERDGAPISGIYKVRYAELTAGGAGPTKELTDLDGTAGGASAPASVPSECLDLETGVRTMLTPDAARVSTAWHLCFRRQTISVNGETGGPRNVGAVDMLADKIAGETVDQAKARTAESENAAFETVTASSFDGKVFRGDRIVSGFGDAWIDRAKTPGEPAHATWLVVAATSAQKFFIGFDRFENATAKSPGTIVAHIKPIKG